MNDALLEAIDLKKSYRQGAQALQVLRGVSLKVGWAEFIAIVGPSGSGKSTLLHLLAGLDAPTGGQVLFQGRNFTTLSDREQAKLRNRSFGFMFQFYHLIQELTALENVALPAWMGEKSSSRAGFARARELLDAMGLKDRLKHLPSQLSGGEQQRVALARALINRPHLVFCDEPTGNLDAQTGKEVLALLRKLHREEGTAFVMVTHEQAITQSAQKVFHLRDGILWD